MKIGICGYATAGKDEVANILATNHGFEKVSWADALRRDMWILNPIVAVAGSAVITYRDAINCNGYNEAKVRYPELRRLLQDYGTDVHRTVDEDYWIKRTLGSVTGNTVFPDTRFPNEAEACDLVILVNRPGVGPVNGHASDAGLAFPYARITIDNDGTLEDLADKVEVALGRPPVD